MGSEPLAVSTVRIPASDLPRVTDRVIETPVGRAIGHSARWEGGQYCAILTRKGLIGCGAYHVPTIAQRAPALRAGGGNCAGDAGETALRARGPVQRADRGGVAPGAG